MDAPPVQYVKTSDGYNIAYSVCGKGTPLLSLPGPAFYHVQLAWQYPRLKDWLEGLSQRFQLIQLDPRGFGMSSRQLRENLTRRDYLRDIEAVAGRLKLGKLLIVGAANGDDLAVDYALLHPDLVIAIVLGTSGRSPTSALFDLLPAEDWDTFLYSVTPRDRSREERERIVALRRQAMDQRNYVLHSRVVCQTYAAEAETLLSRLSTSVLVLHSRDYAHVPVKEGMKKAQLTSGRLALIDGTDPWGDADQGIRAIEAFLADISPMVVTPDARLSNGLSQREAEVLRLLAAGKSNQQIADTLVISVSTVLHHVTNILTKTGCSNRTEAAGYAHQNHLV
jgi:DNA-binding CsgD family transcriptional regulator/pimeloyl-ACP methyl ester carboxylesterase